MFLKGFQLYLIVRKISSVKRIQVHKQKQNHQLLTSGCLGVSHKQPPMHVLEPQKKKKKEMGIKSPIMPLIMFKTIA